ncbi:MAG: GFA family protein [Bauldia sp.]|nr:GFA family protein [Bauldia sp.]
MDDETKGEGEPVVRGRCLCGSVGWSFAGKIPDATFCNCTACRRYGVLWAYDYDGHAIHIDDPGGRLTAYRRGPRSPLTFNFCRDCGNLVSWRGTAPDGEGRTRIAVNLRLAEPDAVAGIPLLRFDGLHSFEDLPTDGRTVGDVWF